VSDTNPGGQRPIMQTADNARLFVQALSAAYNSRTYLYNPDVALARDAAIWEKVHRYPRIAHALQKRAHKVATRDWNLEPGGDEPQDELAASIVEQMLRQLSVLPQARFRLARAPILGCANEWMEGRRRPQSFRMPIVEAPAQEGDEEPDSDAGESESEGDEGAAFSETPGAPPAKDKAKKTADPDAPKSKPGPVLDWWTPTNLRHIDYRRVRLTPRWETGPDGKEHLVDVEPQLGSITDVGQWTTIPHRECLLRVVYDDEEGRLGYGRGIMEAIYWGFWIIELLWREGLEGVERWAQGWVIGSIDEAMKGATADDAQTVATEMLTALEKMRGRGVFVKSTKDEVEVVQTSGTGHTMVRELIELVEEALVQLILGSIRPSGQGDPGANAQGKVEKESTDEVISFDRLLIDGAISERLIGLIWKLNGPQFAEVGCGEARPPRFVSVEGDDEDPLKFGDVAKRAQELGLPLVRSEVYRRLGLQQPGPDDDVIEPPAVPSPFGGGPFDDLAGFDKGKSEEPPAAVAA
jgi:hypothetical protein